MKQTYFLALAIVAAAASASFGQVTSIPINDFTFNTPSAPTNGYTPLAGAAGNAGYAAFNAQGWTITEGNNAIVSIQAPNPAPSPTVSETQDTAQNLEVFENGSFTGSVNVSYQTSTNFVAGDYYLLSAAATVYSGASALSSCTFYIADSLGITLASTTLVGLTPGAYMTFTVPFESTGLYGDTGPVTVGLAVPNQGISSNKYIEVDNFALTQIGPVPEPSSIAFAALGGLVLFGLLRRQTKQIRPHLLALAAVAFACSTGFSQTFAPIVNATFDSPSVSSAWPSSAGWRAAGGLMAERMQDAGCKMQDTEADGQTAAAV